MCASVWSRATEVVAVVVLGNDANRVGVARTEKHVLRVCVRVVVDIEGLFVLRHA